jgi:hypothetical protein
VERNATHPSVVACTAGCTRPTLVSNNARDYESATGKRSKRRAEKLSAFRPFRKLGHISRMPDYRCNRVPGGTFFFTVNLLDRNSDLLAAQIDILRDAVRRVRTHEPFRIDAWVVLPDHMHWQWTLAWGPCRQAMPTSPVGGAQSKPHS